MFDAKKNALMNLKAKHKSLAPKGEEDPKDALDSEKAPDINSMQPPSHGLGGVPGVGVPHGTMPGIQDDDEAKEQDMLHQILGAIASKGDHTGRSANTLGERASDKAKEKFAAIQKHKKDVV